jgi:hypothetical protein
MPAFQADEDYVLPLIQELREALPLGVVLSFDINLNSSTALLAEPEPPFFAVIVNRKVTEALAMPSPSKSQVQV